MSANFAQLWLLMTVGNVEFSQSKKQILQKQGAILTKLSMVAVTMCLLLSALLSGSKSYADNKAHAIHVRNETGGRVDFEIRDFADSKVLIKSYLPINHACAIFPTDSPESQWQVRCKKEKSEWSAPKVMKENDGWLELK